MPLHFERADRQAEAPSWLCQPAMRRIEGLFSCVVQRVCGVLRDIDDPVKRRVLAKDAAGGRSTSYSLVESRPERCGRFYGAAVIAQPAVPNGRKASSAGIFAITVR